MSIAEEYKSQVREEANQSYREGERDAMEAVREYATQSYHEGEREAVSIAEQARLNAVDAARWAGVAQAKQEEGKNIGGGKPLAMLTQKNLSSWFEQQVSNLKNALFSSGDESPTFLDRLYWNSEWNQARNSTVDTLKIQQKRNFNKRSGGQTEIITIMKYNFRGIKPVAGNLL
ncbi:MAG: hypothetical protein IPJ47_16400 [Anaerolineales bacterium]|nr:hypothetical protein [Anaerolineales bacterium]